MTQDNPATAPNEPVVATPEGGAPAIKETPDAETIASGSVPDAPQAPAEFPEDWRAKLSGGDEKELKRLERFGSPNDVYKAYREMERKLSSGTIKQELPKNATSEQLAEWRKDNGIPEAPEGYDLTLPEGLVIGEDDKPLVEEFLKDMHAQNASPKEVKGALTSYYKLMEQQAIARQQADEDFKAESLGALQAEWGADFRKNVNMVSNLLSTVDAETAARIQASRTPEGHKFGDDPVMMKIMNQWAREINPAASVVPGAGSNAVNMMAEEKAAIEARQRFEGTGPYTEADRLRYIEITAAEQKMKVRAA